MVALGGGAVSYERGNPVQGKSEHALVKHLCLSRERLLYRQSTGPNPLSHRDDFARPALRHESLNPLFQVALYLPSYTTGGHAQARRGSAVAMAPTPSSPKPPSVEAISPRQEEMPGASEVHALNFLLEK